MSKKALALLLAVAMACALTACARREPGPPPDLTGDWIQPGDNDWCHIAAITEDTIKIWWYIPARSMYDLYWSGSFTPPEDDKEPYSWVSVNDFSADTLNSSARFNRATREEEKTFTYKDGKISYIVTSGHLQMGYVLERIEDEAPGNSESGG